MGRFEESVFPFTTEEISGYFKALNLKDKSVLTVGSSGDQAFNAIYYGARKVTVFDINPYTGDFIQEKKKVLLESNYENYYENVLKTRFPIRKDELFPRKDLTRMNPYMSDKDSFRRLQEIIDSVNIEFINGDIFSPSDALKGQKFDHIILSNVLQGLLEKAKENNYTGPELDFLKRTFIELISFLNEKGILQFLYYYCYSLNKKSLSKVCKVLEDYILSIIIFDKGNNNSDAVVTYVKR